MTKDKLRIMYASNAPWCNSGYGVQGRSLLPRLKQLDVVDDVAIFAWYGLQGGGMMFGDIPCYPAGIDAYGNDMYAAHCKHFRADILITLIDAWVIKDAAIKELDGTRWLPWMPVDHDPVPDMVLRPARLADLPITYAKFGQRMLEQAGVPSYYIPHGVEVDTFKVLPDEAVAEFRRKFCDDAAWLGMMVSANKGWPSRKGFVETMLAFKQVLPHLPQPARLYIHTDYAKAMGGGDLVGVVKALDLEEHVRFPDRYKLWVGEYDQKYLALMYNAADIFLGPSRGEGFGIPIVEAQACGTPVIVTRFSSMPELVRWGVAVEPERLDWTYQDSWQAVPSVPGIAQAMVDLTQERLALGPAELRAKRMAASGAIHQEFDWDTLVKDYWRPLLTNVLADINAKN
jgi:glycosyltransferase involved in cell wall biosynthesis